MKTALVLAIALTASATSAGPILRVTLADGSTFFVRAEIVTNDTYVNRGENWGPRTDTKRSKTRVDWCVVVKRRRGGYLMDWRETPTDSNDCPRKRGTLIRADESMKPLGFANWPEARRSLMRTPSLPAHLQEFIAELSESEALSGIFQPAVLLANGQGADFSSNAEVSRTSTVEMGPAVPTVVTETVRIDGASDRLATVVWSRKGQTSKWWTYEPGEPPAPADKGPEWLVQREDQCRYSIDVSTGLATSMTCSLVRRVRSGAYHQSETVTSIEATQTLAR